jgi:hypothetical protein
MIKLSNILKEVMEQEEQTNTDENTYDKVIKDTLKTDIIPPVQGKYKLGQSGNVKGSDLKIFTELYKVSPPTAGKEVGSAGSKGSGNGEIALYWLFKYQNPSISAQDSRGVDNPDLIIDGYGVEVKSIDKKDLQLGRYGHKDYKEILLLLNDIFSLYALSSLIAHKKSRIPTAGNFNQDELEEALESIIDLHNDENLKKYSEAFPIISNIFKKTNIIFNKLGIEDISNIQEAGGAVLKKLIVIKLTRKLNLDSKDKGYMVNISSTGELKYYEITKDKIEQLDNSIIMKDNNVTAKQSFLSIKPDALFK